MIITVVTVGSLKEVYLKEAVTEYKKRLSQYARVEEINIKEEPIKNEDSQDEITRALDLEGKKILAALPKDSYKIALAIEGIEYSSLQLAGIINSVQDSTGKLTLVIGSSHGMSESVKRECDRCLSFSKLTFPHQLIRVILYEALYRSFTIIAGKKYHK